MTEERIAFLFKAASDLSDNKSTHSYLKSYYMMRCLEITKGYGLPQKQFSAEKRCTNCQLKWIKGKFETKLKSSKLSKKQRKRINSKRQNLKETTKMKLDLLAYNELERMCHFCNHTTIIRIPKPTFAYKPNEGNKDPGNQNNNNDKQKKISIKNKKTNQIKKALVNIYCQSKDAFSLQNKNNTIIDKREETPKLIKNNKRKKDKFAGLCKDAVLASAKIKEMKKMEQNPKLNLFLKPSK